MLQNMLIKVPKSIDINFDDIARFTPGFVAADLDAIIRNAAIFAYHRSKSISINKSNSHSYSSNISSPNSIDDNISMCSMVSMESKNSMVIKLFN